MNQTAVKTIERTTPEDGYSIIDRHIQSGQLNLTTKKFDKDHLGQCINNLKRATDSVLGGRFVNPIPENAEAENGFDKNNKYVKVWSSFKFFEVNVRKYYTVGMNKYDFVTDKQMETEILNVFRPKILQAYPNYKDDFEQDDNRKHITNAYIYRLESLFEAFVVEELTMALIIDTAKRYGHTNIKMYQSYNLDMLGIDSYMVLNDSKALAIHNITGSADSWSLLNNKIANRTFNTTTHQVIDYGGSYDFDWILRRLKESVNKIFDGSKIYFPSDIESCAVEFQNKMRTALHINKETEMFLLHS